MSFIAGYIATLVFDGTNVEVFASDATLSLTNETLDKTTLGVSNRNYITGLQDGTIDIAMHLDTAGIVAIQGAYDKTVPVTLYYPRRLIYTPQQISYATCFWSAKHARETSISQ